MHAATHPSHPTNFSAQPTTAITPFIPLIIVAILICAPILYTFGSDILPTARRLLNKSIASTSMSPRRPTRDGTIIEYNGDLAHRMRTPTPAPSTPHSSTPKPSPQIRLWVSVRNPSALAYEGPCSTCIFTTHDLQDATERLELLEAQIPDDSTALAGLSVPWSDEEGIELAQVRPIQGQCGACLERKRSLGICFQRLTLLLRQREAGRKRDITSPTSFYNWDWENDCEFPLNEQPRLIHE